MNPQASKTSEKRVFKLKPISKDSIERALDKADQYRLLNQPQLAESICHDILALEPDNQKALVALLLALTDQFGGKASSKSRKHSLEIAGKLKDEYSRVYYTGIVYERQASTALHSGIPGAEYDAYEWYLDAMEYYEKADKIAPSGNDDAVLRWNTCARNIMQHNLEERPFDDSQPGLE